LGCGRILEIARVEVGFGAVVAAKDHVRLRENVSKLRAALCTWAKRTSAARNGKCRAALTAHGAAQSPASEDQSSGARLQMCLTPSEWEHVVSKNLKVMCPVKASHAPVEVPIGFVCHRGKQRRLAVRLIAIIVNRARVGVVDCQAAVA
jgi:hypothetical protein